MLVFSASLSAENYPLLRTDISAEKYMYPAIVMGPDKTKTMIQLNFDCTYMPIYVKEHPN